MKSEYYSEYSHELNRDMEFKVFGDKGIPCLVFPAQNGRFFDFENFGMIEAAHEYIDAGRIQFFCCDSIDDLSLIHIFMTKKAKAPKILTFAMVRTLIRLLFFVETYADIFIPPHSIVSLFSKEKRFSTKTFRDILKNLTSSIQTILSPPELHRFLPYGSRGLPPIGNFTRP